MGGPWWAVAARIGRALDSGGGARCAVPTLVTLKRRAEFQRIRGGRRWSGRSFVVEGKARAAPGVHAATPHADGPRFGFTVTRKLGNAVVRNRIRRRLRAALVATAPIHASADYDYVVIARQPAHEEPFATLLVDLVAAFRRIGVPPPAVRRPP